MSKHLQKPLTVGAFKLAHRVVLAPLTRVRADEQLAPRPMVVEYYAQRASKGGLLISEATNITGESYAYHYSPGIWTEHQVEKWRLVTDAVHQKGGYIMCQLWHTGRVAASEFAKHPLVQEGGLLPPVSASDVEIKGRDEKPRPLTLKDIARLKENYIHAAKMAKKAGFDGVEVHGAHGYLLDQFLNDHVNKRSDQYGGSIENRCRLLFEVVDEVIKVYGADRVAVRLSPHAEGTMKFYGVEDSDPDAVYSHAITGLSSRGLAYLLLTEPRWNGKHDDKVEKDPNFSIPLTQPAKFRALYNGVLMGAGGFTPATADQAVGEESYDLIAFGRWFISNPDLPQRLFKGQALNRYNRGTFYSRDAEGYTDYPEFDAAKDSKYELVEQSDIGTSLSDKQQSKL